MCVKYDPLEYSKIILNQVVKDSDNNTGIIINNIDIHNISVEFINGGSGLYCLYDKCEDYDPLFPI